MSAELAARRTAAAAVLADFGRWDRGEIIPGDWQVWRYISRTLAPLSQRAQRDARIVDRRRKPAAGQVPPAELPRLPVACTRGADDTAL